MFKRFSRLCRVPRDLKSVTEIGEEAHERDVLLTPGSVAALWSCIEALYRTGVQPGVQLCVRHGGQVVLDRAIGHSRGNEPGSLDPAPTRMSIRTPINLFSASKPVTALLMHKLEELGHLRIDDRVADYIPNFGKHGKHSITIRQVLTHRAAIQHLPRSLASTEDLAALADPAQILDVMVELKPQGVIGGAPAYHALSGGFVLAEIMRRTTGQEPRALLDSLIKVPLELEWLDFGVRLADVDKVALNAVTGVTPQPIAWQLSRILGVGFDKAVEMSNHELFVSAVVPSGNVVTTARDVAALYQCLINGGKLNGSRVFAEETVRRAIEPDKAKSSIDRTIGIPIRYSPGFMVGHGGLGLYGWGKTSTFGHLGLSSTLTWARPDTGTVIALVTNGKPILGPHLREMMSMFAALNAFSENRLIRARVR